jgi:hypothetical protein
VTTTHLLAFLAEPTTEQWKRVNTRDIDPAGDRPIDNPISHACSNGAARAGEVGCVNGLEHGRMCTRAENELHKLCTNGALAVCPFKYSPVKCIFVHRAVCRSKAGGFGYMAWTNSLSRLFFFSYIRLCDGISGYEAIAYVNSSYAISMPPK